MFGINDKVTFTLVNFIDKEGLNLNMCYSLPFTDKLELPENIREVSLFEAHQGKINEGYIPMKFYVGKKMKLEDIFKGDNKINFIAESNFISCHEEALVTISDDGTINVLKRIVPGDVVVPDVASLEVILNYVSDEVKTITNATNRIKGLHK